MMKKTRYFFSMLEVVLAVTVVGAGLTLMLVMFPVALRCARDTVSNNYVPMIASSFITQVNSLIDADEYGFADTGSWVHQLPEYGSTKNDIPAVPDVADFLNVEMGTGNVKTVEGNVKVTYRGSRQKKNGETSTSRGTDAFKKEPMSLYSYEMNGKDAGYVVLFKSFNPRTDSEVASVDQETYDKIDFAAGVTIEKYTLGSGSGSLGDEIAFYSQPVSAVSLNNGDFLRKVNANTALSGEIEKCFVRLRLTIAWPLEATPEARNRRVYIMDKSKLNGIQ